MSGWDAAAQNMLHIYMNTDKQQHATGFILRHQ